MRDAAFFGMNDPAIIRSFEASTGKRLAIIGVFVAVIALLIYLGVEFRGRHIAQNAAALAKPAAVAPVLGKPPALHPQ